MLKIIFFYVGHGDSILLKLPSNKWGIIDCNELSHHIEPPVLTYLKQHNIEELEFLCLTHPHDDHVRGMDKILDHFGEKINSIWLYSNKPVGFEGEKFLESNLVKCFQKIAQIIDFKRRRRARNICKLLNVDSRAFSIDNVSFIALAPRTDKLIKYTCNLNDLSIVIKIIYGQNIITLTGDATRSSLNDVIKDFKERNEFRKLKSDIFKIPHHGSKHNITQDIIKSFGDKKITKAIISADGEDLPDDETLALIDKYNLNLFTTYTRIRTLPISIDRQSECLTNVQQLAINMFRQCVSKNVDGYLEIDLDERQILNINFVESESQLVDIQGLS